MIQIMIFYPVAGTLLGAVAGIFGAGLRVSVFASLIGPPILHVTFLIARSRGMF